MIKVPVTLPAEEMVRQMARWLVTEDGITVNVDHVVTAELSVEVNRAGDTRYVRYETVRLTLVTGGTVAVHSDEEEFTSGQSVTTTATRTFVQLQAWLTSGDEGSFEVKRRNDH